jgi:peptidoglycan hydrolase-like protein with peptidoglycan-binding domain
VLGLQQVLAALPDDGGPSYYAAALDGDFGPITEAGVRRYQTDRALVVDGIVGEQTWLSAVSLPGLTLDVTAGVAT